MHEELFEVFTPNPGFNGRRYGVEFKKGKGLATRHQATILMNNWKYRCPALDAPKSEVVPDAPKSEVVPDAPKSEVVPDAPKSEVVPDAPKSKAGADNKSFVGNKHGWKR